MANQLGKIKLHNLDKSLQDLITAAAGASGSVEFKLKEQKLNLEITVTGSDQQKEFLIPEVIDPDSSTTMLIFNTVVIDDYTIQPNTDESTKETNPYKVVLTTADGALEGDKLTLRVTSMQVTPKQNATEVTG